MCCNMHLVMATLTGYFLDQISPQVALLVLESAEVSIQEQNMSMWHSFPVGNILQLTKLNITKISPIQHQFHQHLPSQFPPGIFAYTQESVLEGKGGVRESFSFWFISMRAKQMCDQWYRYSMTMLPNFHTSIRE